MRTAIYLFTAAALLIVPPPAIAEPSVKDVPEYLRFRAAVASLYGVELGRWIESFGTKDRASREATLHQVAKLLEYRVTPGIHAARTRNDAEEAYYVESQTAAYAFRRTDYVREAYKLGAYVGQMRAMLVLPKISSTERQSILTGASNNIEAVARSLGAPAVGVLAMWLAALKSSRNRADLDAASQGLLEWHELFLRELTPPAQRADDLFATFAANARRADLEAFQWGLHAGSWRLRLTEPSAEEIRIVGDAQRYFGFSAAQQELPVTGDDLSLELVRYYFLGASASRLLALRGLAGGDKALRGPVQSRDAETALSSLRDLEKESRGLGLPEPILAPIAEAKSSLPAARTYGDFLQVLESGIAQWSALLGAHLVPDRHIRSSM